MFATVFLPLLCLGELVAASSHRLPASFPRCQKKDPNIDTCLLKATEASLKKLYPGEPTLGLFPLEPLTITELSIGNAKGGSVSIDLQFKDLQIRGVDSLVIQNVKSDLDNYFLQFSGVLRKSLDLKGKYKANGRVLILPIHGAGDCTLKLDDVFANFTIYGREMKKNGAKYMDIKDLKFHFKTSKLTMYFHQLLGGPIGDNLNVLLNDNWQDLLKDLQPAVEDALSQTFKSIAQRIFSRVPYDQIFL